LNYRDILTTIIIIIIIIILIINDIYIKHYLIEINLFA